MKYKVGDIVNVNHSNYYNDYEEIIGKIEICRDTGYVGMKYR